MSRQMVIEYLNTRTLDAWTAENDQEAADCARFAAALEQMTDEDYESVYAVEVAR